MCSNLREIVNGTLLSQYDGKKVSIIGYVLQIDPNGSSFELRTVDDHIIKIMLRRPLNDELRNYVEVHGLVQGKSIIADEVLTFEKNDDFDSVSHNKACILVNSITDIWKVTV